MADFEGIVRKYANADGNIPADAISKVVGDIKTTVGKEFVDKERYKAKLGEIDALTAEKQNAEDAATKGDRLKVKYDALKSEFEEYKSTVSAEKEKAGKQAALKKLLQKIGISDKPIGSIIKVSDLSAFSLDENGEIVDSEKLEKAYTEEWADFITTTRTQKPAPETPPSNTGGKLTKEQIMSIKDAGERQRAIAANHELFGF